MLSAIAPIPSTLQVQAQPQLDSFKHTPRRCVNNAQQKTDRWSAGPTVRYEDGGIGLVTAGHPPPTEKIDHKALPKTQAIPPSEAGIHRREGYSCQQSNRAPLHAAVAHAPYRHDNLGKHLTR